MTGNYFKMSKFHKSRGVMKEKIKRFIKNGIEDGDWIIVLLLIGIGLMLNLIAKSF